MDTLYLLAAKIKTDDIGLDVVKSDSDLVTNILNPVYLWAGIVCVIVIIAAGIMYTISAGSADKVKRAKNAIIGAIIGLIFIMMAFTITQFVLGRI